MPDPTAVQPRTLATVASNLKGQFRPHWGPSRRLATRRVLAVPEVAQAKAGIWGKLRHCVLSFKLCCSSCCQYCPTFVAGAAAY